VRSSTDPRTVKTTGVSREEPSKFLVFSFPPLAVIGYDSQKMRTLVIGYDGEESGHGRYCRAFLAGLRAAGEEAALHSVKAMPSSRVLQTFGIKQIDRTARTIANAVRSIVAIRRNGPRVVHFQLLTPLIDRWWIPHLMRDRISVLTLHNIEPHEESAAFSPSSFAEVFATMDALIVHSDANKQRLEELYSGIAMKVSVIPHGIWRPACLVEQSVARRILRVPPDRPIVLFFGVIRRNKGLGRLLEAMSHLRHAGGTRPLLVIAGQAPAIDGFKSYTATIHRLGLEDCVVPHIGRIPEHLVGTYYSAANVVALPYDRTFQAQSGVLFDAYAHMVPVVATDVGAIGETVRRDRTGLVIEGSESTTFAEALSRLLGDEKTRSEMRARMGRLATGMYSWESVGARTRELYDRIEQSVRGRRRRGDEQERPTSAPA
jgi:D-inositol-3-phosphate glycosyltransferase